MQAPATLRLFSCLFLSYIIAVHPDTLFPLLSGGGQCSPHVMVYCFRRNDKLLPVYVIPAQAGIQTKSICNLNSQISPSLFILSAV
jgi:hypothetical protein